MSFPPFLFFFSNSLVLAWVQFPFLPGFPPREGYHAVVDRRSCDQPLFFFRDLSSCSSFGKTVPQPIYLPLLFEVSDLLPPACRALVLSGSSAAFLMCQTRFFTYWPETYHSSLLCPRPRPSAPGLSPFCTTGFPFFRLMKKALILNCRGLFSFSPPKTDHDH